MALVFVGCEMFGLSKEEKEEEAEEGEGEGKYGNIVFAGMEKWKAALDIISLERVNSPDGADITVEWIEAFSQDWGGEVYTSATEDASGNITFSVTSFRLAVKTSPVSQNPGQFFTEADILKTSTHEMGHALGLGHSPDEGDVMNPSGGTGELSERDIATIRKLYSLENGYTVKESDCGEDTYLCIGGDWQQVSRLFRWNAEDFPLKIYIPEPSPDLLAETPNG
ncbi:MAG: matrixin family metalloprotease [bacterium]